MESKGLGYILSSCPDSLCDLGEKVTLLCGPQFPSLRYERVFRSLALSGPSALNTGCNYNTSLKEETAGTCPPEAVLAHFLLSLDARPDPHPKLGLI